MRLGKPVDDKRAFIHAIKGSETLELEGIAVREVLVNFVRNGIQIVFRNDLGDAC